MATGILEGLITLSNSERRRCMVDGKKAMFHRWNERSDVVDGEPAGQIRFTLGIVEYEDGGVDEVYPCAIKFCDDRVKEVWENAAQEGEIQEDNLQ